MIGSNGLELIKYYEGLHDGDLSVIGLQPKLCPAGIWTVGYGRALTDSAGQWLKGDAGRTEAYATYPNLTEQQAVEMLIEDCGYYENRVKSLNLNLSQDKLDALISFTYNVGFANFKRSTLLQYIQSGESDESIKWAFCLWNKARINGIMTALPGLTKRRRSESVLFTQGILDFKT